MDEAFAAEARSLDGSNRPIQTHGHTVFELGVGVLEYIWSDEIQGAVDVFLSVLVEDAPGGAYCTSDQFVETR